MSAPPGLAAALRLKRKQLLAAVDAAEPLPGFPGALSLTTPELPEVWELNVVLAPPAFGAERLIDAADERQRAAGLAHRKLRYDDVARAEPLRAAAELRGWTVDRELVMLRERGGGGAAALVEELDPAALAAAEDELLAAERHPDDAEARRQLVAQHDRWARNATTVRLLGIVEDGRAVAWCRTYDDGTLFEIDDVAVLPSRRGRGLGRTLIEGAIAAIPRGRTALLLADADDWPRRLYARLGFVAVGERLGATRPPDR